MARVFVAVPAFGQMISSAATHSLMALSKALYANGHDFLYTSNSYPDIAELREMLLSLWFDRTDCEYMLQIDADMGFEPQLVLDMLQFDKPLIGTLYPQRTLPINFNVKFGSGPKVPDRGFLRVEGFGFGVTLIRRDCVEALLASGEAQSDTRLSMHSSRGLFAQYGMTRLIRAFQKIETESGALSEDYSFCRRALNSGIEPWAAIDHEIKHVGPYAFTGRFADVLPSLNEATA